MFVHLGLLLLGLMWVMRPNVIHSRRSFKVLGNAAFSSFYIQVSAKHPTKMCPRLIAQHDTFKINDKWLIPFLFTTTK